MSYKSQSTRAHGEACRMCSGGYVCVCMCASKGGKTHGYRYKECVQLNAAAAAAAAAAAQRDQSRAAASCQHNLHAAGRQMRAAHKAQAHVCAQYKSESVHSLRCK